MMPACRLIYLLLICLLCRSAHAQQFNYNFDSLKHIIDAKPNDTASAKAYIDYAAKFFYIKSDSGLYYINKALPLAKRHTEPAVYLYGLKNKGDHYSVAGDFKTAARIYQFALKEPSGPANWLLRLKIRSNLGTAYKNLGLPDSALLQYQLVEQAFAVHPKSHLDSVAMAFSYMQLYDLYQVQGLLDEAIYYGVKGYQLSLKLKFDRGIGYGLFIQGLKYQHSRPSLALQFADRALQLAIDKNIPELQQFTRGLKAKILIAQGKYLEAKNVLEPGTRFTAGSSLQVAYAHLAEVYYYLNDLAKALSYFQRSYKMARTSGYQSELAETLKTGIAIYEKRKDYQQAYRLQQEYQQVQDKIASAKLKLDYQRSSIRFKTAEKDKELAQKRLLIERQEHRLNRQNLLMSVAAAIIILTAAVVLWQLQQRRKLRKERETAARATREVLLLEAMMQGEEQERERIATDLHDGVGGLLSALKMRLSTFRQDLNEPKRALAFEDNILLLDEASAEIRKTAHNLSPDMLNRFGLDEAIQAFCDRLNTQKPLQVDYQSLGEIGRFQESFELAVYRILQELLNNSLKHAGASEILVQLTRQANLLNLSIEDNGRGFDPTIVNQGLGLRSVNNRVQSLRGTMDIDTAPGKGTAIYIELDCGPYNK